MSSIHQLDFKPIIEDLNKHKRDRNSLLEEYINERLRKSLYTYYKELSTSVSVLNRKDNMKVMKNL